MIKPQFEAGRQNVGKNGIVKSRKVHERILYEISEFAVTIGFKIIDLCCSPVTGGDGNIEYLIYMDCEVNRKSEVFDLKMIVDDAFGRFRTGGK